MNLFSRTTLFLCLFALIHTGNAFGQVTEMKLLTKKVGAEIQPTMYGLFFEDINFGADGGLYGELLKNRSFEFDQPLMGWIPFGDVKTETADPAFDRNPTYVRLTSRGLLTGTGIENQGFRGIGLKQGEKYRLTFHARTPSQNPLRIKVELVDHKNDPFFEKTIEVSGAQWNKKELEITPSKTDEKASIRIWLVSRGSVDMDHISLFPVNTFKNRENGMRADLGQALADLNPGLFRFPGGCIVEGTNLATRYQWKHSVGPVENRPININRWNYTFAHRKFSDYYQSYGLGFYDYFLLSEDIGAEPLPVLHCGLSCQFENKDPNENVKLEDLGPYIQDAIDLIEFANGPVTSEWGKLRAEMGHPEPFNLKFLAIGNEQWDTLYTNRLPLFVKALREKHPEIKIVGSSGPYPDGKEFDYLWPEMKKLKVDLVDEHYYRPPVWFRDNAARYDSYDRKGPAVFAGEYACHHSSRENNFESALCEAAFMTGFERNADIVHMCTYAPLFAHVELWQWRPDLIWFDNLRVLKTPNYYIQQLYATYKGTHVLPLTMGDKAASGQEGWYASAALDKDANEILIKVANLNKEARPLRISLDGLKRGTLDVTRILFQHDNMLAVNSFEKPDLLKPVEKKDQVTNGVLNAEIPATSFQLFRVPLN